jgi:hypothetical protein
MFHNAENRNTLLSLVNHQPFGSARHTCHERFAQPLPPPRIEIMPGNQASASVVRDQAVDIVQTMPRLVARQICQEDGSPIVALTLILGLLVGKSSRLVALPCQPLLAPTCRTAATKGPSCRTMLL